MICKSFATSFKAEDRDSVNFPHFRFTTILWGRVGSSVWKNFRRTSGRGAALPPARHWQSSTHPPIGVSWACMPHWLGHASAARTGLHWDSSGTGLACRAQAWTLRADSWEDRPGCGQAEARIEWEWSGWNGAVTGTDLCQVELVLAAMAPTESVLNLICLHGSMRTFISYKAGTDLRCSMIVGFLLPWSRPPNAQILLEDTTETTLTPLCREYIWLGNKNWFYSGHKVHHKILQT